MLSWYLKGSVDHALVLEAMYAAKGFASKERIPMTCKTKKIDSLETLVKLLSFTRVLRQ